MPYLISSITRVSTTATGAQHRNLTLNSAIAPDGQSVLLTTVALASSALVGPDNSRTNIYLKNLASGAVQQISLTPNGGAPSDLSQEPIFSPDGSKILFRSLANDLVANDFNRGFDVFMKDLRTGEIQRITTSGDTRTSFFSAKSDYRFSADGTKVIFSTNDPNLVPNDTNGTEDVFIKDLTTGSIVRVSTAADGTQGNDQSTAGVLLPDNTHVLILSRASNFVPNDTTPFTDLFLKNLATGAIERIVNATDGGLPNQDTRYPSVSADGTKVAFASAASNLVAGDTNNAFDIFVLDLPTRSIQRVSTAFDGTQANSASILPTLSPDGSKVAFVSNAGNLVAGDTNGAVDVFIKDLATGLITRIGLNAEGVQGNRSVSFDRLTFSADGSSLVFTSYADNLVAGDTNGSPDAFLVRLTGGTEGNDVLTPLAGGELVEGRGGNDRLLGTALGDRFDGGAGNDLLDSGAGSDRITGNAGADLLRGREGADTFQLGGSAGADLAAPSGATVRNTDMLNALNAAPDAVAVAGRTVTLDILDGGDGNDLVLGTSDADVVVLSAPGSAVYAGQSANARIISIERFELGDGDDVLSLTTTSATKYATNVTAFGGEGNDVLWTGSGNDVLDGGIGNDNLVGGIGDDLLAGGAGRDLFGFARGFGTDVVADFVQGEDRVRIKGFGTALDSLAEMAPSITRGDYDAVAGADLRIDLSAQGTTIVLSGFTGTLTAADFQFVA